MDALIGVITGFFLGSIFSIITLSFCIAAKRGDEYIGLDPYDDSKETKNDDEKDKYTKSTKG